MVRVALDFSGGMELLFGGRKCIETDVPSKGDETITARDVIVFARDHLLEDRPELFSKGDDIRPGVLVLINDEDWELLGGVDAVVKAGDAVTFISTLHGG